MNGIIIVDKPAGWTSHDVVAKLRGALKIKRIGHGGTLDPMATGVLPLFVGRATRASEFCENAEKEYIAGIRLGIVTDTQDITGKVLSTCTASSVTADLFKETAGRFLGASKQLPPMYSAVRVDGKKLYKLARSGIEVPRPERPVFISEIEMLESGSHDFLLRVVCSKGTYIRTLCHDIGSALGCGAAMSSLRRTKAGVYDISMAHTLENILSAASGNAIEKIILPVDSIFQQYPRAELNDIDTKKCKNGVSCTAKDLPDGRYRFYCPEGEFLMLGETDGGNVRMVKGFYISN